MYRLIFCFLVPGILFVAGQCQALQKPKVSRTSQSAIPPPPPAVVYTPAGKIEKSTGIPRSVYHVNAGPFAGDAETIARNYLSGEASRFGLKAGLPDLSITSIQRTPGGNHVRFRQTAGGLPVAGADVVVSIDNSGRITFVSNNYRPFVYPPSFDPSMTPEEAVTAAHQAIGLTGRVLSGEFTELMVHAGVPVPRLAYRVITPATSPRGEWETFIDAITGEVISVRDAAVYDSRRQQNAVTYEDGSGYVYNPDPLTSAHKTYGASGFTDNNGADSPQLTAERKLVTLRQLSFDGIWYTLTGPYVSITDWDPPAIEPARSVFADSFQYTRSQTGFQDVMVYYQIDSSQRYLQSIGYSSIQNLPIMTDAHGDSGADNAYYSPNLNRLSFGDGGVDDGEDADVIWHEYGHAIEEGIVSGWGGGEEAAMGEGFGDYWAGSYSRAIDPSFSYDFVFTWDAGFNGSTGSIWGGRPLNDSRLYPAGGVAGFEDPHDPGQIWSSVLMVLNEELGRPVMDRLVIQSHYYLGNSATMPDGAAAILQADQDLFAGAHFRSLNDRFFERRFFLPPAMSHLPLRDTENLTGPYPVTVSIAPVTWPLDTNSVRMIWWSDSTGTDTIPITSALHDGNFTTALTAVGGPSSYHYYFISSDITGHQATLPPDAPVSSFTFYAGRDTILPSVHFVPLVQQSKLFWPPVFRASATDNIGIRSVTLEYLIPRNGIHGSFELILSSDSSYSAAMPVDSSQVEIGDTIRYRIIVSDAAGIPNTVTLPSSGYSSFYVTQGSILIINNDPAVPPAISSPDLFARLLRNDGFTVTPLNYLTDPYPPLGNYDLVIMSAGANQYPFVINAKVQAVADYAAAGGRTLVEGGNVGYMHRADGPLAGSLYFRRQVLHDSSWISDVTASSIVFNDRNNRIFNIPNKLSDPIPFVPAVNASYRDAMSLIPGDSGAVPAAGWTQLPASSGLIVFTPRGSRLPTNITFAFALSAINDTAVALKLAENAVWSFFPGTGLSDAGAAGVPLPAGYSLDQNFPNPFNPSTTIRYTIPVTSYVTLRLYSILGQQIAQLVTGKQVPGVYNVVFPAADLASGIYFYRLDAVGTDAANASYSQVRKMMLIK